MRRPGVVLVMLVGVLGGAACGIKAAPRPPLPPPGASQPRPQGEGSTPPPQSPLFAQDSGTQ